MLKKIVPVIFAALFALGFVDCREKRASPSAAASPKKKVALCIARNNDLSFQQSAYEGLLRIGKELAQYYDVEFHEMGSDTDVWEAAITEAAAAADFVAAAGYQNKHTFETVPKEFPNTKFILFDQDVDYSDGSLPNVLTVLFDSNESGFLAGAVAAYWTNSAKSLNRDKTAGFVGGMDSEPVNNFLVGYAEGVHYVDPGTKILTGYIGDFMDTARAKELAQLQISQGADIIFQVAGSAGNGVIEAASERAGVMAIGVDADQYKILAGTGMEQAVLTSSLKRLDNAFFKIMQDCAKNISSVPFGSTVTYGLSQAAVGIVFNDNLTSNILDQDVASIQNILVKIQTGEIKVSHAIGLSAEQINAIVNK